MNSFSCFLSTVQSSQAQWEKAPESGDQCYTSALFFSFQACMMHSQQPLTSIQPSQGLAGDVWM